MSDTPNCAICGNTVGEKLNPVTGEVYWNQGEDAYPVANGRACTPCADNVVLPARLEASFNRQYS